MASPSFVWGIKQYRNHAKVIAENNQKIAEIEKKLGELEESLDHFKSMISASSATPMQVSKAKVGLLQKEQEMNQLNEEMKRLIIDNGNQRQPIENTLDVMRVGVGLPVVTGGTYGYLSFKNNKQEG
jgi:septal ring factor EnvC (AmiA/AmiB activator)